MAGQRDVPGFLTGLALAAGLLLPVAPAFPQGAPPIEDGHAPGLEVREPESKYKFTQPVLSAPPSVDLVRGQQGSLPGERLDIPGSVVLAVEWHPSIQSAIGYLSQSDEGINAAKGGYYPNVRGGFTNENNSTEIERYGLKRLHRFTLSVSQMLYDFGKVSSRVDEARAARLAAQARVLLAIDDIARNTALSVIEVLRYQELLEIANAQVEGVGAIGSLATKRRELGASTLSDEVQAQSRGDAAVAMQLEMQAQLRRWRSDLSQFIGRQSDYELSETLPDVLAGSCRNPVPNWMRVPSVMVAEAEHAQAKAALEGATAQTLPTLTLEGDANRVLNHAGRGPREEASIMINVSMPMYQGGSLQASRRAASHMMQAAASSRANAVFNADRSLKDASARSTGFEQRIAALEQRVRSMRTTRELYRQQYLDLGSRTLLDLLNAEQEMHQANMERVNNLYDLYRLQVDCLYYTGSTRDAFGLGGKLVGGVEIQP